MQNFKVVSRVVSVFFLLLFTIVSAAQEHSSEINVDINKGHAWYTSPWVWIFGAIAFIFLLLALLRGTERRG